MSDDCKQDLRTWIEAPGWVDKMCEFAIAACLSALRVTDEPLCEADLNRMHDVIRLDLRDLLVVRALNDQRQKVGAFIRDWADGGEHLNADDSAVWGLLMTAREHATVRQGVVKAAHEMPTGLPGTALARICTAYLGGDIAIAPSNLDDVIKTTGFLKVMGRLAVLYPDLFYHWVCLYEEEDPFLEAIINAGHFSAAQIECLYRQQLACRLTTVVDGGGL